jgi:hypothetical protein
MVSLQVIATGKLFKHSIIVRCIVTGYVPNLPEI